MFDLGTCGGRPSRNPQACYHGVSLGHSRDTPFTKRCVWNLVIVEVARVFHSKIGHRRIECMDQSLTQDPKRPLAPVLHLEGLPISMMVTHCVPSSPPRVLQKTLGNFWELCNHGCLLLSCLPQLLALES